MVVHNNKLGTTGALQGKGIIHMAPFGLPSISLSVGNAVAYCDKLLMGEPVPLLWPKSGHAT